MKQEYKKILKAAKYHMQRDGYVALKWLINEHLNLNMDKNRIHGIAAKLTSGIHYIYCTGHNPSDIFIKSSPEYRIKIIGIAIATLGLLLTLIKLIVD